MQKRAQVRSIVLIAAMLAAGLAVRLSAQPLVRETPTTLVLPIRGTGGSGAGGTGMGGGAVGTVLPATLSQTGAFADLSRLTPARGLVPYEPNAVLWSDYAKKTRWFGLTSATSTFGFRRDGSWALPAGAVWVKHFDLEMRRGDPTSVRRVETRFLVRSAFDPEDRVTGYSYRWNDDQTDATLVPVDGAQQTFQVSENGVARTQTWTFPSRLDCQTCHNSVGGPVLSFNTRQLNRPGRTGVANPITALAQAGYLDTTAVPAPESLPALVDASDTTQPLETRVRSYLEVNCSQCHRPGIANAGVPTLGEMGAFDARATIPLSFAAIVNGPLTSATGDGTHRVVVPGDPAKSQLLARMSTRGATRMPPLATNERDLAGEALVTQWITALAVPLPASRIVNLSTRAQAPGGAATPIIAGFVIGPGAAKSVLIRAAGPSLNAFSVGGSLANPSLTLFDGTARSIATNTRWNTSANAAEIRTIAARVGAFAWSETGADSAILATLSPGAYTAHVTGTDNAGGIVLLEMYDGDATETATRLINTSVRAQVGVGASVVIPGLVVSAGATKTVLVRAVGPGLAALGVPGPLLAAPVVRLFAGAESFAANTRWNSAANAADIRTAAQRAGAFALAEGSADSAMLVSLSPAAYTIQVSGAGNTSGVALVELFEIP